MEKRSKRWTTDETKAFLHFYAAREEQFSHPRKKRSAYGSVVEDMIAAGFDSGFTSRILEVKMQTLLRAYRDAKDNSGRTGASPCIAPFLEQMDELFAKKPNFSKSDSYNFGAESVLSSGATVSSPDTSSAAPDTSSAAPSLEATPVPNDSDIFLEIEYLLEEASLTTTTTTTTTTTPPPPPPSPPPTTTLSTTTPPTTTSTTTTTKTTTTTTPPTTTKPPTTTRTPATLRPAAIKRRAMSRSDYYKEKIIQRQREAERVEERFQERQQTRAQQQLKKAEDRRKKYELIEKILTK